MKPREQIYVKGYRLSSGADVHEFRPYKYNGAQPFTPPKPPSKTCSVADCIEPPFCRGFCSRHHSWHVKQGKPLDVPLPERVLTGHFQHEKCGTVPGHAQHRFYGVPVCEPCRDVYNAHQREYRKKAGSKMRAAVLDDYDEAWAEDAVATIVALSLRHTEFSSDDLRREMRPANRPGQYGAAFRSAKAQGLIESAGYKQSTSKTRNNGSHQVWRAKTTGVSK